MGKGVTAPDSRSEVGRLSVKGPIINSVVSVSLEPWQPCSSGCAQGSPRRGASPGASFT